MSEERGHATGLVTSLVCHAHVDMALDCLGSLLRLCAVPLRLQIHDDGTLTDEDVERLRAGLDRCAVIRRPEADARMQEALRGLDAALRLREHYAPSLTANPLGVNPVVDGVPAI